VIDGEEDALCLAAALTDVSAVVLENDILDLCFPSALLRFLPLTILGTWLRMFCAPLSIALPASFAVVLISLGVSLLDARAANQTVISVEVGEREAVPAYLAPLAGLTFDADTL